MWIKRRLKALHLMKNRKKTKSIMPSKLQICPWIELKFRLKRNIFIQKCN